MASQSHCGRPFEIGYNRYLDKVLGGWIGKSIGGIVGAPFEAHKILGDATAENCWPAKLYPNDDLDIQIVWLEMLEERGPNFARNDLVEFWQDRCWYNFAEYGCFLYNVQRGISSPLSGGFNNVYFSESMGCPIRAEIWGLICPGNPSLASEYARMDGEQDHIGNSVWSEQFWAAAIAQALLTDNLDEALNAGLAVIPADSKISGIFHEVRDLYAGFKNWRRVWKELIRKYGHRDCSKAEINFAFTVLSLLNGKGDLKQTIVTAINCGWDSDCTAATAGALTGVLLGGAGIPSDWKAKMGDRLTCDVNVRHKTALLTDLAVDTCKVGLEAALMLNQCVKITDAPDDLVAEVRKRSAGRVPPDPVQLTVDYPSEPVLWQEKTTEVILRVTQAPLIASNGELTITSGEGITVSPDKLRLSLPPGGSQDVTLMVRRGSKEPVIWDKNLLSASLGIDNGKSSNCTFGLAGSRQWLVYGPYWDAWDTTKSDICPYRNDQIISHPIFVEGCQSLLAHQYVRLDKPYLDETALLKEDLKEEYPFRVERGEDHIDNEDLGGFVGEACYYLVRNIVARAPIECNVTIGSTGPFVVWMDGEEVLRSQVSSAWYFGDYGFRAAFDSTPRRVVIKCIKPTDQFRFSMCFIKLDVPGDKKAGVSYMLDTMGDLEIYEC